MEVHDVGRFGTFRTPTARLSPQGACHARRHRRRGEGHLSGKAYDVDPADGLLRSIRAFVTDQGPHMGPRVLNQALGEGADDRLHATQMGR